MMRTAAAKTMMMNTVVLRRMLSRIQGRARGGSSPDADEGAAGVVANAAAARRHAVPVVEEAPGLLVALTPTGARVQPRKVAARADAGDAAKATTRLPSAFGKGPTWWSPWWGA